MPYRSATFSLVIPMGDKLCRASSFSKMLFMSREFTMASLASATPPPRLMLSTPAPMPASIWPDRMEFAMLATAWSPDEHCRLTVDNGTVSGKPAVNAAMRAPAAYAPPIWTLPTLMSPSTEYGTLVWSTTALSTARSRTSGFVFRKAPRRALPMAVRSAEQSTTSSGDLWPAAVGLRWTGAEQCVSTWERRARARSHIGFGEGRERHRPSP